VTILSGMLTASVVGAGSGGTLSMVGLRDSDRFELIAVADISSGGPIRAACPFGLGSGHALQWFGWRARWTQTVRRTL
jgi:hypothetical protein